MKQIITIVIAVVLSAVATATAGQLITGKQIKNHSIGQVDVHKNSLTGKAVKFPAAKPVHQRAGAARARTAAAVGVDQFEPVASLGTYDKLDPLSVLQVSWTGLGRVAGVNATGCIFELRIDGAAPTGGVGEVFTSSAQPTQLSATALFSGVPVGTHDVDVYARASNGTTECVIDQSPIPATASAAELVQ